MDGSKTKTKHALRRRRKICIILPRCILHRQENPIILLPALAKIIQLVIKLILREPISVREIMHGVGDEERVGLCGSDVGGGGRLEGIVVEVEEGGPGTGLALGAVAFEDEDVVASK